MIKTLSLSLLLISYAITGISQSSTKKMQTVAPVLFSGLNTALNERDMAISPDGMEMFYTVYLQSSGFHTIIHLKKDKTGKWSSPAVAPFSGNYSDLEPAFSADGQKLFFCSNRPNGLSTTKNFDIWVVERRNGAWLQPSNLGPPINTGENEFFPSVAANGNLYFTAAYSKGPGKEDIYVSKWIDGKYSEPVALDSGVNSTLYEFNAFVTPDEKYIVFSSFGRKDDRGRGDLYISVKDENGTWRPARNLTAINSERLDYCPFISFDRKTLFFTSERHSIPDAFPASRVTYEQLKRMFHQPQNGTGNIYQVSWDALVHTLE